MEENEMSSSRDDASEFDFSKYFFVLCGHKKFVFKVTTTVFVLSIALALALPKTYSSTALILPPQPDPGMMGAMMGQMQGSGGLASLAGGVLGMVTPADQYASILESDQIKSSIIDRFQLMKEYEPDYRLEMYKLMDKIVDIKAGKKDGIISITVEDENPKKAAAIANGYVDELGKLVAMMSTSDAARNRRFLENRLAAAKTDLVRAEEALKQFQKKYKALDVPEQAKASITGIATLQAQLAVQESQLSALRGQFTDSSQEVINAKAGVADIQTKIRKLEGDQISAIPSVGSVPALSQEQVRLLREFKTQELIVDLITKQNEIAKMTEAKNINTIQVIQAAQVPDKKIKPKRLLIVIGSTFFSLLCSCFWVLFLDYQKHVSDDERMKWRRMKSALSWNYTGD